ncbi:epiplakin, partial [Sigmodon hispidus]
GFFDPNTHENLTYLQLLRRCVRDPETGFYMLQLAEKGSTVHHLSEELRRALREARVSPGTGDFQGQSISVWELLFYREVPEALRQDLLRRYQAGGLTVQDVSTTLISLLARTKDGSPHGGPQGTLGKATMEVKVGRLRGQEVPVWDILTSSYVSRDTRKELLAQFSSGTLTLPMLTRRLTTIIEEAEQTQESDPEPPVAPRTQQEPTARSPGTIPEKDKVEESAETARQSQEQALRAATMRVHCGQFRGRPVSVWQVLFSSYLSETRREELLAQHLAGTLALHDLITILTQVIDETEERLSKVSFRGLRHQ